MAFWVTLGAVLCAIALLGGIGAAIRFKKAYWLISGYNKLPEEKKKNVDVESLGRLIGNSMFAGCGILAVAELLILIGWWVAGLVLTVLLLLPGATWLIIRAQRYDRNVLTPQGRINNKTKLTIGLAVLGMAAAVVLMVVPLLNSTAPASYTVVDGALEIKCAFGETVELADIPSVELVQAVPDISARTRGSELGDKLRGSFTLRGGAFSRIFTETWEPPFLHFISGGREFFINCATPADTRALYDELEKAIGK